MVTSVYTSPAPETAANKIVNAMTAEEVVIICCSCDVEYDGRAGGYLPTGNRTIMVKPDGNFLVIGSTKHKPRNWQPTGADTTVQVTDDTLILQSTTDTSRKNERLITYCDSIYELITYDAGDDPDVTLNGTEEDMHMRIMESPELIEEGFESIEHEKPVDSGRSVDIFGRDINGCPVVIEVKRRRGQRKDVDQLHEYTNQVDCNGEPRGILVAPSVSDNVWFALEERGLEFIQMNPREEES